MVSSSEILAAFREVSNSKQLDRSELYALLQDGILAALAKKYGPNVQAEVNIDDGKLAWKYDTEQPLMGSALATAGDLVFFGEGNGNFNALDAKSGKKLWTFNCGAGANAQPVSYMVNNKQYVAMGCGGNVQLDFKRGNSLFVYTLGD